MTYRLISRGRLSWSKVVEAAKGLTCAWADLDGFHVGPAPTTAPPYSHLWGWSPVRCLRARIDGDGAIVGVLAVDGTEGEVVETQSHDMQTPKREGIELGAGLTPWAATGTYETLTVIGPMPVTFVRARTRA